ncbi:MAG: 4-alpha-glucanotransferase, partial [Nocardioidaceae bacterium]
GYHVLRAVSVHGEAAAALIVTPAWLGVPERLGAGPAWGLAAQLYSVRSGQSWGVGDLTDMTDLAVWSGAEHGADFLLVNPLHAGEPAAPLEPSPYLPMSRRFVNPLYLRPERVPEYATMQGTERVKIDRRAKALHRKLDGVDAIDRDTAFTAKLAALRVLYAAPRTPGREADFRAFCSREGRALSDFATWMALATEYGANFRKWPTVLQHPDSPETAAYAEQHREEVTFHMWLQWLLDEQIQAAQAKAVAAGMCLGIVHDLAVGVHPAGADAWRLQDIYATGMHVGAPPDAFNQMGQDWSQPPWRPDRLAEAGYAPFRDMIAAVLRHAGGVRVDHIIGLFRLWWVPVGNGPAEGTYVRYDHEAMVGILALEAHRAGAVVIGEDLGVVEPSAREYLAARGLLGTSILWFERDESGRPLPAEKWRELCLASVTTHDLPPTAGYLAGDHVRLRNALGLLTRTYEEEVAADEAERRSWLDELHGRGLLDEGTAQDDSSGIEATVRALHEYLTLTPARLLSVSLADAVADRRTQNQPGTTDEYPNWRVPLSGPDGAPLTLEEVLTSPQVAALVEVFHGASSGAASPGSRPAARRLTSGRELL